jgi:hypothetical protein
MNGQRAAIRMTVEETMSVEDHQDTPATSDQTDAHIARYASWYGVGFVVTAFVVIFMVLSHRLHY